MKFILMVTLLSSSLAFAKVTTAYGKKISTTNTSSKKFDIRVPIKNWVREMNDGFIIGFAQGTLDTNMRLRDNGFDDSITGNRNTKSQIHFGWQEVKNQEVGYNAYFTYQDIAEGLEDLQGKKEDVRSMRWSANATYGIDEKIYTYGGLNLNKYYGSEEVESKLNRGIGFQAGLGVNLHKRMILEVEYLTLLNEGRVSGVNVDVEAKGILLKLNTPFQFNI